MTSPSEVRTPGFFGRHRPKIWTAVFGVGASGYRAAQELGHFPTDVNTFPLLVLAFTGGLAFLALTSARAHRLYALFGEQERPARVIAATAALGVVVALTTVAWLAFRELQTFHAAQLAMLRGDPPSSEVPASEQSSTGNPQQEVPRPVPLVNPFAEMAARNQQLQSQLTEATKRIEALERSGAAARASSSLEPRPTPPQEQESPVSPPPDVSPVSPGQREQAIERLDKQLQRGREIRAEFVRTDGGAEISRALGQWRAIQTPNVIDSVLGPVFRSRFEAQTGNGRALPADVPNQQLASWNDENRKTLLELDAKLEYLAGLVGQLNKNASR